MYPTRALPRNDRGMRPSRGGASGVGEGVAASVGLGLGVGLGLCPGLGLGLGLTVSLAPGLTVVLAPGLTVAFDPGWDPAAAPSRANAASAMQAGRIMECFTGGLAGMNKVYGDASSALKDILRDGMTIMAGGFGLCGIPENLISAIKESGVKDLTFISNNAGVSDYGLGLLMQTRQIRKMISSYVGENKLFEAQVLEGVLEVELTPQGTLAERIRAGGAGIPAFFTPTGYGTKVAEGKEVREFDGKWYVLERSLKADLAIIKAFKGDAWGNLQYRKSTRNFNPVMATAADVVIAEIEHMVDVGAIDADCVHTPGIYVDRLFVGAKFEKRIEQRTVRSRETAAV
jgi:3-oxoacid CoA-transferase subunit A